MKSSRFNLSWRDLLKGAVIAVVTPALYVLQSSLEAGQLVTKWQPIVIAGVSGFVAYLIKNFFTDDVKAAKKTIEVAEAKASETI